MSEGIQQARFIKRLLSKRHSGQIYIFDSFFWSAVIMAIVSFSLGARAQDLRMPWAAAL